MSDNLKSYRELSGRDIRLLKKYFTEARQAESFENLETQFLDQIEKLIPSDAPCWNNFTADLAGLLSIRSSHQFLSAFDSLYESFGETVLSHPVLKSGGWRLLEAEPQRISDFESNLRFRENPLYREVYRHVDANYQIGFTASQLSDRTIIFTLNRKSGDFDSREIQLLDLYGRLMEETTQGLEKRSHYAAILDDVRGLIGTSIESGVEALTVKETEALGKIHQHGSVKMAAHAAGVTVSTFDHRLASIREKLELENTGQLRAVLAEVKVSKKST